MPEIGQTISHFQIIEKVGEGGMGVVYRAEDSNLDRRVTVKVLSDSFAGDPQSSARIEGEAKLLASLNHPNIATIHGLEQEAGSRSRCWNSWKARLVGLRYFVKLNLNETAEVLKVARAKVKRDWGVARVWMYCETAGSGHGS